MTSYHDRIFQEMSYYDDVGGEFKQTPGNKPN